MTINTIERTGEWLPDDLQAMNDAFTASMLQVLQPESPVLAAPEPEPEPIPEPASEPAPPSRATMQSIAREVCDKYDVTLEELRGPRRQQGLVIARQEAMCRMRNELPHLSFPQIGKFLRRDHTTVLHGVRKHEQRLAAAAEGSL